MRVLTLVTAFCAAAAFSQAQDCDLIIRNGRIIDGAGNPWFYGDVAVAGGRIAAVGTLDPGAAAPRVIDAQGHYIAPGFIDVHTHCEDDLLRHPDAENFIRMGVTTIIMGNCGSSYPRLADAFTSQAVKGASPNYASLAGHNTIRQKIMGNVNGNPSTTEIAAMKDLVGQAMRDGAVGLSTGLIYTPGIFAKTPEIVALAAEAKKYGGIYATHMRSEGNNIFEAINEAITVGRETSIPVHISHFKIVSPKHFGESTRTIQMIEDARRGGLDVTADQYLYTASSTGITMMLPDWALEGTSSALLARLRDPVMRKKMIDDMIAERRDKAGRKDLSYARVANFRADASINGMNLLDLARKWRGSESWEAQNEVILDIVTSGGASMVYHSMSAEDVRRIAQWPLTMFGSDSGVRVPGEGMPHPRGYGNCARALAHFVRDTGLLRLEDAVRKMTSYPAQRFGFHDRGLLRPGCAADIVIFDLARVSDNSTFDKPHAYASGFTHVIVNGVPVIDDERATGQRPGKPLYGRGRTSQSR